MARSIVIVGQRRAPRARRCYPGSGRRAGKRSSASTALQLDLGDDRAIRDQLEPLDFDVLVNCAAQTNVDHFEREPAEAFRINSIAVGILAEICARKKTRCIHISTDYVFDGKKETPYRGGGGTQARISQ